MEISQVLALFLDLPVSLHYFLAEVERLFEKFGIFSMLYRLEVLIFELLLFYLRNSFLRHLKLHFAWENLRFLYKRYVNLREMEKGMIMKLFLVVKVPEFHMKGLYTRKILGEFM